MKLREVGTIILVVFALSCGAYTLIHKFKSNWIQEDNFVEQYVEDVVESKTGLDIDLTPEEETGGLVQNIDWNKVRELIERFGSGDDEE